MKSERLKNTYWIVGTVVWVVLGLLATVYFKGDLEEYKLNSGTQTISFFIAPFFACGFFAFVGLYKRPGYIHILISLFLMMLIYVPILNIWNHEYDLSHKSDNFLYYRAAKYMLQHASLNSRDDLLLDVEAGKQYLYQPGFKYYLALLLSTTNGILTRQIQFIGIFLFTICNLLVLYKIAISNFPTRIRTIAILFFWLMMPAVINNIMDGLSEGVFICFLLLFFFFYLNRNFIIAGCFLGLAVFLRQYFLIAAIPIFLLMLIKSPDKVWTCLAFAATLLIPVYHNYYYANEFRFFADYSWMPEKYGYVKDWIYDGMIRPYKLTFLYYFGIADVAPRILLLGFLFIPLGLYLLILGLRNCWEMHPILGILFFGVAIALIWPSISYAGFAGYPRFQLVNYSSLIILYFVMETNRDKLCQRSYFRNHPATL